MEDVKKWFQSKLDENEQLSQMRDKFNDSTIDAIRTARSGFASMEAATTEQVQGAQGMVKQALEQYKAYEAMLLSHLKAGVFYSLENPYQSSAIAVTTLLLTLPRSRHFLFRNTIGRFRSEESMILNAEAKLKSLQQNLEILTNETKKLEERARLAEVEFLNGRQKLKATGKELTRLSSSITKTENRAKDLIGYLRQLPFSNSIKMLSQVATMKSAVQNQKAFVNKRINAIANHNINV